MIDQEKNIILPLISFLSLDPEAPDACFIILDWFWFYNSLGINSKIAEWSTYSTNYPNKKVALMYRL